MHHFRRKSSSSATPLNSPPPTPKSPVELIVTKEIARIRSKTKSPSALAASSGSIALSIGSPLFDPLDTGADEPGSSGESGWRTAYGVARMAVGVAKESSDMFLPLKAVVGALSVFIENYDQTAANVEQIKEIEERVQSLAQVLASPVGDQDREEKARRDVLRRKLAGIIAKLGPLSEQHGLMKFLKNVDHANVLNGFVQDLSYAVTDYQISIQQGIYKTAKKIDENTQNIIETTDLELLGKLDPVRDAGYQACHHDTCLRGTRESVLDEIMRWVKDPQERHIFWLNGLAGTGKSTVAQTLSEVVANIGILGASFFCSRDYLNRKELKNIFPTLAYQLACRYPAFRKQVLHVIKQDPSVIQSSLISQLKDLIVGPLSSAEISCVIVVDALDECVDDQPASAILSVLGRFVNQLHSVKFFITGRPEPRIRTGFRLPLLEPITQILLLHNVEPSSVDEDIRLFLREKLTAVAKRRSDFDLPDPWPCDEDLTALTKKSSGLFIFASTLARFIESEHHVPNEQLQLIVTSSDSTLHEGRAGIDPLYTQVLAHAFLGVEEARVFDNLRRVLGVIVLAFNPLSRAQIAKIFTIDPSLIKATLRHLHSVLLIPEEDSKEIRIFHKSFPDFLQDSERCLDRRFYIFPPAHHVHMALGCLELLKNSKWNPCGLPDFVMNRDIPNLQELLEEKVGGALRYACAYWAMHVRSSSTDDNQTTRLITSATEFFFFSTNRSLPWIEVMSLDNRLEGVIHSINNFIDWLGTVKGPTSGLESLAKDCLRFTMQFFPLIQQSTTHIYHSALPLSPKSSMFSNMSFPEITRIAKFYGRPDNWGLVLRTITGILGDFTCLTTIGQGSTTRIAAAYDDGTVHIYDSVTGVLRLCLNPPHPIQAMTGHPDGSILFCTHREIPSITLWDIQTGGPIHTFVLETEARDTAISLNGRYLACGLSDGTVDVWDVANRTGGPAFESRSPIASLCWLAPEGRLMVATELLVEVRDIAAGGVPVYHFELDFPVCGAAYSQKLNQLAIVTDSGLGSIVTIIDAQTGKISTSCWFERQLSCLTFSQTTEKLVCGTKTLGLESITVSSSVTSWRSKCFDLPATITSVSTLSNGTVVANVTGPGIQLLNLDGGSVTSRQLLPPTHAVHPLDEDRIITVVPTDRNRVILLETATMSQVLSIPAQKNLSIPTDRTVVLCASLENKVAVYCFAEGGKEYLQFWGFVRQCPWWTVQIVEPPSAGSFSPTCGRLVTFNTGGDQSYIRVWDVRHGTTVAELVLDGPQAARPHNISFDSEDLFYFHHGVHRVLYSIGVSSRPHNLSHSITRLREVPVLDHSPRPYYVDDGHEWVVCGSQRICWIPPGYIGSAQASHCWVGYSLVMTGQDGTLRKLTFREPSLDRAYLYLCYRRKDRSSHGPTAPSTILPPSVPTKLTLLPFPMQFT